MNNLKLSVEANKLTITQSCNTTGGSANYDECEFTFDSEWNGFTKMAVFSSTTSDSYRVELENDKCKIPSICIEEPGLLKIGVYGFNDDDVMITTNSVVHRVEEGVDTANEWVEDDNNFVRNAVTQMQNTINDFKNGLSAKFTELLKNVTDETEIKFDGYLPDWYIPATVFDAEDIPLPSKNSEYDDYLNFKLNKLTTDFPSYVRKYNIGEDASEEYGIFSYVFNPGTYVKSMVITACVHGTDRSSLMALSYFLDNLCRNTDDRVLAYIKNNIKLYVIPVVNPYGLENGKTRNSEDVNIGANFPFKWSESQYTHKGESAGDQAETQAVINYISSVHSDKLCALLDLHTSNLVVSGRTVLYPKSNRSCATALCEVVNDFNYKENATETTSKAVLAPSNNPTLSNYFANRYGINACEIIWDNGVYGGETDNNNYTKYVEFLGNVLYKTALCSKYTKKGKPQPFTKHISWRKSSDSDVYTIANSTNPVNMGISAYSMKLDMPGNIVMNGYVIIDASSACTVKINPILYQINSSEQEYNDRKNSSKFIVELNLTAGTHIIPLSTVLQAYYSSYNDSSDTAFCEDVIFVLAFASSSANSANVTGFSATINVFPTDRENAVEITSPMGLAADYGATDIPTQTLIYPLGTVGAMDATLTD